LAPASLVVVTHERLGTWARQLRPRLLAWPIRWVETRSTADLEAALAGLACPVVLIDLGRRDRVRAGLEDLDRALQAAPNALVLVLDPLAHEGVATLARELGATHVLSGPVTPPSVAQLVARWLPLAQRQAEGDGWAGAREPLPAPEPWNWLGPLLAARPDRGPSPWPSPNANPNGPPNRAVSARPRPDLT
jgi:CheY-like chemotaxis protein